MPSEYSPLPGAAGWQFSNPSVLDVVSLLSSLRIFESCKQYPRRDRQGGHLDSPSQSCMESLREKSIDLTGYLELLLQSSRFYVDPDQLPPTSSSSSSSSHDNPTTTHKLKFTIITPSDPTRRGCQLSLLFTPASEMQTVFDRLRNRGILGDERKPGVIRFGPTPLYNTFEDARETASALEDVLNELEKEEL